MVTELRIYFEGDGRIRPGLRQFLKEIVDAARLRRCRFELIDANGTPVQDFHDALLAFPEAWNVLLLDAESPAERKVRSDQLKGCDSESIFWMVQTMESWFLADPDALKLVFKSGLNQAALRGNPRVEEIPKADVFERLDRATGGRYHKVEHGAKLLEIVDPAKVRKAAPNCDRIFEVILRKLTDSVG